MTMYVQVNVCLLGASTVVFVGEYYTNSDWRWGLYWKFYSWSL